MRPMIAVMVAQTPGSSISLYGVSFRIAANRSSCSVVGVVGLDWRSIRSIGVAAPVPAFRPASGSLPAYVGQSLCVHGGFGLAAPAAGDLPALAGHLRAVGIGELDEVMIENLPPFFARPHLATAHALRPHWMRAL